MIEALLAQLMAIRAQADAAIALLTSGQAAEACPHPIEARRDLSTMGGPKQFHCRACDETITEEGD